MSINNVDHDEPYAYQGLEKKFVTKVKKELRENPDQVKAHIASLRRWLKSMPHITAPDDDRFLLKFLRNAKFDHCVAQQALDNFCTIRSSPKAGSTQWYPKIDVNGEMIRKFLDSGLMVPFGSNDEGELMIILRFGKWDVDNVPFDHNIATIYAGFDLLLHDEMAQISGLVILDDLEHSDKQCRQFNSPKLMFKLMRNWQDALPMRMKAEIQWKEPMMYDVVMALARPFMKPWLRDRMRQCGTSQSKLFKAFGGKEAAMRYLPTEFGGNAGPVADFAARFRERMAAAQPIYDKLAAIHVDESKRPPGAKDFLATWDAATEIERGAQGTYTKLDVH